MDLWDDRGQEPARDDTASIHRPAPAQPRVEGAEREQLLRLGRELAAERRARFDQAAAEIDELKRTLREAAAAVAARERELVRAQAELSGRPENKPEQRPRRERGPADPARSSDLDRR